MSVSKTKDVTRKICVSLSLRISCHWSVPGARQGTCYEWVGIFVFFLVLYNIPKANDWRSVAYTLLNFDTWMVLKNETSIWYCNRYLDVSRKVKVQIYKDAKFYHGWPSAGGWHWVVRGDWQETCHYTCGDWGQKTRPKKSVRIIDLSDMTGEEIWKKKMMKKKTVPEEYFWQQQKWW